MELLPLIDRLVADAGPWLLPLLALASLLEYVFPPFPGDTVLLAGAALAARGAVDGWAVVLVTTVASVAGSFLNYLFGRWIQRKVVAGHRLHGRFITEDRLVRLEDQYRRWGYWLIVANRFLPIARAVFFIFAGMSGLRLGPTLLFGALSSLVWNGLMIGAGTLVGANLDALEAFVRDIGRWSLLATVVLGALATLVFFWRRRRAART